MDPELNPDAFDHTVLSIIMTVPEAGAVPTRNDGPTNAQLDLRTVSSVVSTVLSPETRRDTP